MTIKFNVTGTKRKELVKLIAAFTECESKYKGAPTFAYEVDYFTVDKNGALIFDDRADSEEIEQLLERLAADGFTAESSETEGEPQTTDLELQLPKSNFTKAQIDNLKKLLSAKGSLIKEALGVDTLEITDYEDRIGFPWFSAETTGAEKQAYMGFITALAEMAKKQKRVTATETEVENKKYAFRCFLLRLGFIGKEFKTTRKILLRNLEGSSAFKSGTRKKMPVDVQEALADERLILELNGVDDIDEALEDERFLQEFNAGFEELNANV